MTICLLLAAGLASPSARAAEAGDEERIEAYDRLQAGDWGEAIQAFDLYLKDHPEDVQAGLDYINALFQLGRFLPAAEWLEVMRRQNPERESLSFRLGIAFANLNRPKEAADLFQSLTTSANPDLARAAVESLAHLEADMAQARQLRETRALFALAADEEDAGVVVAADAMEAAGPLPYPVALQRLYALYNLKRFPSALEQADRLAITYPSRTELAFLRAELRVQLKRIDEAVAIWRRVEEVDPGSPDGVEARRRRLAFQPPPMIPLPPPGNTVSPEENRIYKLANQGQHEEVVQAINAMERTGPLSPAMERQRLYAWQLLGRTDVALARASLLAAACPGDVDLALIQADLLFAAGQWKASAALLSAVAEAHPGAPPAEVARERLRNIPAIARRDKSYWGEAYVSGDYYGRFGAVVGSGMARHGFFTPKARWFQPYGEFRFSVDTEAGIPGQRSEVADNYVGFYGGARIQVWEKEYVFLYAQAGLNKDLLDVRDDGDWAFDSHAGIYGYKAWGPGVGLLQQARSKGNREVAEAREASPGRVAPGVVWDPFWRGDWFVDGSADFSYYDRYASALGYSQLHQGFRMMQIGPTLGLDAYVVENLAWDVKGNYFDNFVEIGPGVRWLWVPCRHAEVVLRTEWLNGFYFGRDAQGTRGNAAGQYDEVRVGLSVGMRW